LLKDTTHQTRDHRKWLPALAAGLLCLHAIILPAIKGGQVPDYLKEIEPIFREKCAACHNHTVRQGGLSLESYEALMNGGRHGPVVMRGNSGGSRLVRMIEGSIQPRMPIGDTLTADEIKVIKAWVDAGARGPAGTTRPAENEAGDSASPSKTDIPEIKPAVPVNSAVSSLAFQPGGTLVALGRYLEVELIDATKRIPTGRLRGHINQVRAIAFSPDGKLLAAAGGIPGQFGEIRTWSVADRKEQHSIRGHRDNIFAIAFSPDGSTLATCSYDRLIKLWDVATGKEIKTLKDHTDAVFSIAFSPDGKRLASASADRTVKIWDAASGQRIYTLSDALDSVNTVAFHPSGKLIAGAGADRIIRIWELGETEGRQIKSLISHEDAVIQIVYSPDGKRLVSTAADRLIKIWDSSKLEEIHTTEVQPDWVFALALSPDGRRLAAGRYDGSLAFYDVSTGKRLAVK
jgi:WD40 repeat protein